MPSSTTAVSQACIAAAGQLSQQVSQLDFSRYVPWVYNPLEYAWPAHEQYLSRFVGEGCRCLFLGMNPGPWGMAQTGVPFGEVSAVRDWLGIDAKIGKPKREHPKRPIQGWACARSEVSGRRLWGLFAERFNKADEFFEEHFVANYCPLVFMEESARNLTPDKLPAQARRDLETYCDAHLASLIEELRPEWVIGIGAWAEGLAQRVIGSYGLVGPQVSRILHPSPASPAANLGWSAAATKQLLDLKIWN